MPRYVALIVVVLVMLNLSVATADVFINSPGDKFWFPFPYPRNADIDFATNPNTWPSDPAGPPGSWDLQPEAAAPGNYELEGWDDEWLYETDWLWIDDPSATMQWWDTGDPSGTSRQGVVGWENGAGAPVMVDLYWHFDNSNGGPEKHFWQEVQYWTYDKVGITWEVTTEAGFTVDALDRYPQLMADNWILENDFTRIIPNPNWEIVHLHVQIGDAKEGGKFLMDDWHVATECPEPGSLALFGLGAIGLALWRRRKAR